MHGHHSADRSFSCPEISTRRNSSGGNAAIHDSNVIVQHQVNISGNRIPGYNVNLHGGAVNNALGQLDFCWGMSPKEQNIWCARLWNEKFQVRDTWKY